LAQPYFVDKLTGPSKGGSEEKTMNSTNMVRVVVLGAACLLGTTAAWAQTTASDSGNKVAVISMRLAIGTSAEGRQAILEMQTRFTPRQQELELLSKQLSNLQQKLNAGQSTFTEEEKDDLNAQVTRVTQELNRKKSQYQEDLTAAQEEFVKHIGRKVVDVLRHYAQENGYVAVLDSSAQNSPILYASKNIDITPAIVKLYDTTYPVKSGVPTHTLRPAPSLPATPPESKP
jgi:outer membrane protein